MTTRSRRGCMTCRKRKLKCDEARPICGPCVKARKECVPSEGVVFRNQQNPSMNSAGGGSSGNAGDLASFYSYKNTFNNDTVWVDIPSKIEFVHVVDPYADDQTGAGEHANHPRDATATYQNLASHSLEALSTAATANPSSYTPQGSYIDQDGAYAPYSSSHADYLPTRQGMNTGSTAASAQHNNHISFLLNPTSSLSSVIDPNLESSVQAEGNQNVATRSSGSPRIARTEGTTEEADHRVASLLRNFADTPGQG